MRVWLLHVGERVVLDGDVRIGRYGYLSEELVRQGHEVVRWVPSFVHVLKRQRSGTSKDFTVSDRHRIKVIRNPSYDRNVSITRALSYAVLARRVRNALRDEPEPDVVVCGIPTVGICRVILDYAEERGIPVVVDVRDLWPDVFLGAVPPRLRMLGHLAILPMVRAARNVLRRATAITGVSNSYVEWGLVHANREAGPLDRHFPLGYWPHTLTEESRNAAWRDLRSKGVDPDATLVVYFGQLAATYDVETLLHATTLVTGAHDHVQFVVCGTGEKESMVTEAARQNGQVIATGWVSPDILAALLEKASIGLATYIANAPQSIPNKPIEYLSGGLVLISSLRGDLQKLISESGCGVSYEAGNATSLARAINEIIHNPDQMQKMQHRARDLFESKFSGRMVYKQMAEYLSVVAKSHTR